MTDNLTEEQQLLLDCWEQWAYDNKKGERYAGGFSTLEDLFYYLRKNGIINKKGVRER